MMKEDNGERRKKSIKKVGKGGSYGHGEFVWAEERQALGLTRHRGSIGHIILESLPRLDRYEWLTGCWGGNAGGIATRKEE